MAGRRIEQARTLAVSAAIVGERAAGAARKHAKKSASSAFTTVNDALYKHYIGDRATDAHQDNWAFGANADIDLRIRQRLGTVHHVGNSEPQILQNDLPTLAENFKAVVLPAFIADPDPEPGGDFTRPNAETYLDTYRSYSRTFTNYVESNRRFRDVRTKEDLEGVITNSKAVALIKSVEGIYVTESTETQESNVIETIDTLWNDGNRFFGIKWNFDDGTGATTKAGIRAKIPDFGLGREGNTAVDRIDELGGIVDLAHSSDQTMWDVLAKPSAKPRIDSHAGSRAIVNQNRNITDEMAGLIINGGHFVKEGDSYRVISDEEAATYNGKVNTVTGGGIVGMPFVKTFVGTGDNPDGESTVVQVVDHLQHFKDVGLLHGIVLGTDFNGIGEGEEVKGAENAAVFRANLMQEMQNRGFTDKEIRGVFSETQLKFLLKNLPSKKDIPRNGERRTVFDRFTHRRSTQAAA